jgi:6-phosphogluconolactonase (cycloisomerase 2 family)
VPGSPVSTGTASSFPYFLAVDPTGRFVYAAHRGTASSSVGTYAINQSSGQLTVIAGAPTGLVNPRGVAVDPTGRFVYATNNANTNATPAETIGRVSGYAINKTTGVLSALPGSPYLNAAGTGNAIGAIAVDPSGRWVFTANSAGSSVTTFTINAGTGELTTLGAATPSGNGPRGIAVTPNGKYVYVVNGASNDIYGFTLDPINGFLTALPGNPIATGLSTPWSIAVDYSGEFLYVANSGGANIGMFLIDRTTGAISPIVGSATTDAGPTSIAVSTEIN